MRQIGLGWIYEEDFVCCAALEPELHSDGDKLLQQLNLKYFTKEAERQRGSFPAQRHFKTSLESLSVSCRCSRT